MAVRAFDRTVLVRYASIVAGRLHAVMSAQRFVATRLILPGVVIEIAEGGGQAVASMLQRGAAERPQRILQPLSQCHKALTAEHDMSVLPAREGQAEVIEPMIQRHPGDADAVIAHVGEIGKPQPARGMLLPEDDVLLGPVQRPPGTDAPLQRAANTGADLGMAAPDLVEKGGRSQPQNALEQRHHLAVPNRRQRILPPAPARRSLLRREPQVVLKAIGSGSAEPGLCCGNRRRVGLAETHVQPRLAIGDVAPGQAVVPHRREEPASYPAGRDRQKTRPLAGPRRSPDSRLQSGYALLSSRIRRHFLILIDARFSSRLSRSKGSSGGNGLAQKGRFAGRLVRWLNPLSSRPLPAGCHPALCLALPALHAKLSARPEFLANRR